jgi:transcriptional pleiotropic regulator of transition state genes
MKLTGIVIKLDNLGRVIISVKIQRSMEIEIKDGLEIFIDSDKIILMKYRSSYEYIFSGKEKGFGPVC